MLSDQWSKFLRLHSDASEGTSYGLQTDTSFAATPYVLHAMVHVCNVHTCCNMPVLIFKKPFLIHQAWRMYANVIISCSGAMLQLTSNFSALRQCIATDMCRRARHVLP